MRNNTRWLLVAAVAVALVVLSACAAPTPEATPAPTEAQTQAPVATEAQTQAPVATAAPTEAAKPGLDYTADCAKSGSSIKEMKSVDQNTVQITLCGPDPSFLYKIALPSFGVEPKAYIEKTGGAGDLLTKPIGTGPYTLKDWTRGESITLVANDGYWGTKPIAKTLVFRWNKEPAARLTALQSGEADGIDNVAATDIDKVKGDSSLQLQVRDPMTIMYIGMTNTFKPWDNPKVRQALAIGIDRQRIVDKFFPPGTQLADYFTPCILQNGCTGDPWPKFDLAAAKKMLADAGYPNGFSTTIYYRDVTRPYMAQPGPIAQDVQAQLKDLGITAKVTKLESGDFIGKATTGKLEGLFLLGWTADYPYITNFLDAHFSAGVSTFGTTDPTLTDLLKKGSQTPSDQAKDIYAQANNELKSFVPMIPVAHSVSAVAYKADVKGAYASPLSNENFAIMDPGGRDTFVFVQGAEPATVYAADESDGESLHVAEHVTEGLYVMTSGAKPVATPALATECKDDGTLTVWTCTLRPGVKFSDGSPLTADDVVFSFYVAWDASSKLHVGNNEGFYYMDALFGSINKPPAK